MNCTQFRCGWEEWFRCAITSLLQALLFRIASFSRYTVKLACTATSTIRDTKANLRDLVQHLNPMHVTPVTRYLVEYRVKCVSSSILKASDIQPVVGQLTRACITTWSRGDLLIQCSPYTWWLCNEYLFCEVDLLRVLPFNSPSCMKKSHQMCSSLTTSLRLVESVSFNQISCQRVSYFTARLACTAH